MKEVARIIRIRTVEEIVIPNSILRPILQLEPKDTIIAVEYVPSGVLFKILKGA